MNIIITMWSWYVEPKNLQKDIHLSRSIRSNTIYRMTDAVADLGGVRGVQMHPPLATSDVLLRT